MFRFHKSLDIIQLFHKASSPASVRVANLLKQVSAGASESATEDQAGDHSTQSNNRRDVFELAITEEAPTTHQLVTILDYAGQAGISTIVKGAHNTTEALKLFKESAENLNRPVIVDWNNGKVYAGSEESAILKMLNALPKES
ncbi:thioredoxin-like protein [Lasiosphaeris hirsuta]|uniref:Thioredoxin-like protein n=1 Tax=Lasiosphaeris hirsuta TaxID=260670 RepID=A0AA40E7N3_9PEZI|nr:thioredoxin-like protein [Lasiosphaeris hirsuta]